MMIFYLFDLIEMRLVESTHLYQILSMQADQSALKILIKGLLCLLLILLIDQFLSTIFSASYSYLISDISDKTSLFAPFRNENKTCSQRLGQRLANLSITARPEPFSCLQSYWSAPSLTDINSMTNKFQQFAKTACPQLPKQYLVQIQTGVLYKDKYYNFTCFTYWEDNIPMIVVKDQLKRSFNQNCLELLVDILANLFGTQALTKFKIIFRFKDWPFIPILLSAIVLYLVFGPAYQKFKEFTNNLKIKQTEDAGLSHLQKVENGHKIVEHLLDTQAEKAQKQKQERRDVPQIEKVKEFMQNKQPYFCKCAIQLQNKIDLSECDVQCAYKNQDYYWQDQSYLANNGVGLESCIEAWVNRKMKDGRNIIFYNLKNQIDCYDRLGIKNGRFTDIDCILEAIIYQKDRNFVSITFTAITMAANKIFAGFYYFECFPIITLSIFNLYACILIFVSEPLAYFFSNISAYIKIFLFAILILVAAISLVYIVYKIIQYFWREKSDKPKQNLFLSNQPDEKTIVIFDNIQMVYPQLDTNGKEINQFLLKCHHAQQLKKHDIILVSRHANFTKAVLNKDDYLLTDFKYDEENITKLSLQSVRKAVSIRALEDGGPLTVQFGNIFAYFIDNTETLFQAMRKVKLDPKYNKKDLRLRFFDTLLFQRNQKIIESFKDVKKQINVTLQNARAKLIQILDSSSYDKFMKKYYPSDQNRQYNYKMDFDQLYPILLNKIIDTIILKVPGTNINSAYEARQQIYARRLSTLRRIEKSNTLFDKLFAACEGSLAQLVQFNIYGSQAGHVRISSLRQGVQPNRDPRASNQELNGSISYMVAKFLSKWYQPRQQKPNQFQFEMLIEQFGVRKNAIRSIVKYLNRKRVFYFYNFSSSVYALAYFMMINRIEKIDFRIEAFFELH